MRNYVSLSKGFFVSDRQWLYLRDGLQRGPVPESQLRELLRIDVLSSDVLVWTEGMAAWETASAALPRYVGVEAGSAPEDAVEYFPVSTLKFAIMSISTFGMYELFWFYKNWKYFKSRYAERLSPFWRAFFAPLFAYDLFKRVRAEVSTRLPVDYSPGWLAVVYFLLYISWRLPGSLSYISILSFLPLLPVVWTINDSNRHRVAPENMNTRFSGWNVAWVLFFAGLWLLDLVFMIRPELLPS